MSSTTDATATRTRFDRLVGGYYADMFRYAAWLSRDRAVAEDVVQESLLRAWKSLDSLRDDAAAKHWLLTIVRRENARYFERKRLDTVDIDNLTGAQSALLAEEPGHQAEHMREAIFELEDDYREPLVLQVLHANGLVDVERGVARQHQHAAKIDRQRQHMARPGVDLGHARKKLGLARRVHAHLDLRSCPTPLSSDL